MGIIIWLIVGGICGWLASLIMRTDAQQGIILNIVVGIVGAVIAGLLFGHNMNAGITIEIVSLRLDRGDHPSGDRQPDPQGNGPLTRQTDLYERAAQARACAALFRQCFVNRAFCRTTCTPLFRSTSSVSSTSPATLISI